MTVYLLMYSAGQDDSDHVIAAFVRREDAEATLAAMEAIPWIDTGPDELAAHHSRDMDIEGFKWGHHQWALLWHGDAKPEKWPPAINARIEEHDMAEAPLKVTPQKDPAP